MGLFRLKDEVYDEGLLRTRVMYKDKNGKERMIGWRSKGALGFVLKCPRDSKKHFFKSLVKDGKRVGGWGLNRQVLNMCIDQGYWRVQLVIDGGKKNLVVSPQNWMDRGQGKVFPPFEPQKFLAECDFDGVYPSPVIGDSEAERLEGELMSLSEIDAEVERQLKLEVE